MWLWKVCGPVLGPVGSPAVVLRSFSFPYPFPLDMTLILFPFCAPDGTQCACWGLSHPSSELIICWSWENKKWLLASLWGHRWGGQAHDWWCMRSGEGVATAGWAFNPIEETGTKRGVQNSPTLWSRVEYLKPIGRRRQVGMSCPNQRQGQHYWAGGQNSQWVEVKSSWGHSLN